METKHTDKSDNDSGNHSGPISTSEFLDFLKLACHVHETIILKNENGQNVDFNALAKYELVNTLLNSKSGQSPKSNANEDGGSKEKNGEHFFHFKVFFNRLGNNTFSLFKTIIECFFNDLNEIFSRRKYPAMESKL